MKLSSFVIFQKYDTEEEKINNNFLFYPKEKTNKESLEEFVNQEQQEYLAEEEVNSFD